MLKGAFLQRANHADLAWVGVQHIAVSHSLRAGRPAERDACRAVAATGAAVLNVPLPGGRPVLNLT